LLALRFAILTFIFVLTGPTIASSTVLDIYKRSAGADLAQIGQDVHELAAAAEAHIHNVGLGHAIIDFQRLSFQSLCNLIKAHQINGIM
jgi:hypothetical protein